MKKWLQIEDPAAFNKLLLAFLAKASSAASTP
jgi:hypothetical protein